MPATSETSPSDILIVGGGVIGLSLAYELAGQGGSVCVLEQGGFGREASWAGAGILPPGNLKHARSPDDQLRGVSHKLWPELSASLREETGIDTGYCISGGIEIRLHTSPQQLRPEIEHFESLGIAVEELTPAQAQELEPAVTSQVGVAYRLPELGQVRNPRHLKALVAGCRARGVDLQAGQHVRRVCVENDSAVGVETTDGVVSAGAVCIAGGAWSGPLLDPFCNKPGIVPVRGQIVLLSLSGPVFRHVLQSESCYLVPRPDGRVLIGSTEEWVGFDKRNTAGAVSGLIDFGTRLVPALAGAALERTWAGLRPGSPDGLPYLGRVPNVNNVYVAAGHFRSGLQMSPGTARVMSEVMLGRTPSIDLDAFAITRHHGHSTGERRASVR